MIDIQKLKEVLSQIGTRSDLEAMFKAAKEAGFPLGSDWEAHKNHIEKIIARNNPKGLELPSEYLKPFPNNYREFENKVAAYFSSINPDDAILEKLRLISVATKYQNGGKKTLDEVIAQGYIPCEGFKPEWAWYAYDMSNPTKISYRGEYWEFKRAFDLIEGAPEIPYYSQYTEPEYWETDDVKLFKNGNIQFKNLEFATKFRGYMLKKMKNYNNPLIKY